MSSEGSLFGGDLAEVEASLRARASSRTKTQLLKEVPSSSLRPPTTLVTEPDLFGESSEEPAASSHLFVGELGNFEQELRAKFSAQALLKLKQDWTASRSFPPADPTDDRWTPLHQAALIGDADEARKILKFSKYLVNTQNSSGQTPLHVAALLEHGEVAKVLLAAGASEAVKDLAGRTAFDEVFSADFLVEVGKAQRTLGPNIKLHERLGQGADGAVSRGFFENQEVAVKAVDWAEASKTEIVKRRFEREAEILKSVSNCGNVVKFVAALCAARPLRLITEYCAGGSLYNLLHERKDVEVGRGVRLEIVKQAAAALAHVHTYGVMHLDFKSLNLLLEEVFVGGGVSLTVKLCDFGSSRRLGEKSLAHPDAGDGTYFWSAPEVLERDEAAISSKADVYSWAIVAHEVLTRTLPFENLRQEMLPPFAIAIRVANGERPDLAAVGEVAGLAMVEVIEAAWSGEVQKRPDMKDVLDKITRI